MNKNMYGKMAIDNIRKSKKLYLPYLLTIIGSIMFFYILSSISANNYIHNPATNREAFKGAEFLCRVLRTGKSVTALFAVIFLFYANSFILKNQKKQLGLYRVLGMERGHMVRLLAWEILCLYGIGLIGGMVLGILFDKLMLVFLFRIIEQKAPVGFYFSQTGVINSIILAISIAIVLLLRSTISILKAKDIELLKSDQTGEKEPKNRLFLALSGMVVLLIGYTMALKINNSYEGIMNFFPAAFMVIIATYILFTAGSIVVLKFLKKRKKFYYTTRHFISVSGLLYRMKQNAAGLATICVLSTSAVIVLAAGASLYANGERSIQEMYPREVFVKVQGDALEKTNQIMEEQLTSHGVSDEENISAVYGTGFFALTDTGITANMDNYFTGFDTMPDLYVFTLEEYNRIYGTEEILGEQEILLYSSNQLYTKDTLEYQGVTYQVKGRAKSDCLDYIADSSMSLFSKMILVVPSQAVYDSFINEKEETSSTITYVAFNLSGSNEVEQEFITDLKASFEEKMKNSDVRYKEDERDEFYSMYGGILFIGIILGILFLMSTVMIIYYKQISEGYDDRERFVIMRKVGLSQKEIQQTIHSQILLVFFLPLVTAILHATVALKIVSKCMGMVVLVHMPTFIISFLVTCFIFSVIYVVVYKFTSRSYYHIVNES
ncbi:MAG: ABC transporter permease [Lachnospiraceae bacterium]|nr:ABC transporter permease [Lachnospiraceae bacterium]